MELSPRQDSDISDNSYCEGSLPGADAHLIEKFPHTQLCISNTDMLVLFKKHVHHPSQTTP